MLQRLAGQASLFEVSTRVREHMLVIVTFEVLNDDPIGDLRPAVPEVEVDIFPQKVRGKYFSDHFRSQAGILSTSPCSGQTFYR
ncbi:hypothetical protein A6R68_00050 [Neotoma lepida]|uniref:Uncharacterized protein n=1 Tax=Neotoma lepida TaxID=56216 RepID=A0A1A6GZK0_NEOLE|nr:hypothetical protein A6R68_00050 [Neotoma lepida]